MKMMTMGSMSIWTIVGILLIVLLIVVTETAEKVILTETVESPAK